MSYAPVRFEDGAAIAVGAVIGLGLCIVGLAVWYLISTWSSVGKLDQALFETVVIRTFLPMFSSSIAAVLAWVFGKHLVEALAHRLQSRGIGLSRGSNEATVGAPPFGHGGDLDGHLIHTDAESKKT